MITPHLRLRLLTFGLCGLLTAVVAGCSGSDIDSTLSPNSGSTLTTKPDDQLTEAHFLGKWDLDGELTNTANGNPGVLAIPSDIVKDVLGKGWRFEPNGVLRTDAVVGSKPGNWRIEGKNTLVVREYGQTEEKKFEASFRSGFLYLKSSSGRWAVFEKDKYFGL